MTSVRTEADLLERLWSRVAPLIPPSAAKPKGGRLRPDDRACLASIVHVLRDSIRWCEVLSASGPTCWRRYTAWRMLGIWAEIWSAAVEELDAAGLLGMDELVTDANGIPIGVATADANVAESELIVTTLNAILEVIDIPSNVPLIADKADDSDPLRKKLALTCFVS